MLSKISLTFSHNIGNTDTYLFHNNLGTVHNNRINENFESPSKFYRKTLSLFCIADVKFVKYDSMIRLPL